MYRWVVNLKNILYLLLVTDLIVITQILFIFRWTILWKI